MKIARLAIALIAVVALSGCSSPDEKAHEFGTWASTLEYVASVDANSESAHLVVDGTITDDELVSLSEALRDRAASQDLSAVDINLIVGNAWGFSVDDDGANVATINQLRNDQLFVGATVGYRPLDSTGSESTGSDATGSDSTGSDSTGSDAASFDAEGVRGTVGSQAALRDAPAALVAAVLDNGGDVDGVRVSVATADGAFGITGEGDQQPLGAIQLWQAISGRVMLSTARATLVSNTPESLEITVASADDQATAQAIAADYPDITLTVHL